MLLLFYHLLFRILSKFGFKKIWLEKRGKFIELWGEFNSRVLLSYFVGKLDAMPVTASEMKSVKKGSKEWKEAIKAQQKAIQDRIRFQVKVETKADADALLKEMRDGKGMDRYRNHKHKELKYDEGYEVHQAFDRFPEMDRNHAGVKHIKYYSNGTDGHIFFESF